MDRYLRRASSQTWVLLLLISLVATSGCGLAANLFYKGNMVPAAFSGLEGKRVAVICVSKEGDLGPSDTSRVLPQAVGLLLRQNVSGIDLVDQHEIADWTDTNDWDRVDYRKIGRGVEAEMVLAIDLVSMRLHKGQTLYKGTAEVGLSIFDMEDGGALIFQMDPPAIEYPRRGGIHTTDMPKTRFLRQFIAVVAKGIAKNFYEYELKEDIATETPFDTF
jgi:hypothetical protein